MSSDSWRASGAIRTPARGSRHSVALYDQTRHERPISGGYVSYQGEETVAALQASPFVQAVLAEVPAEQTLDLEELKQLGIGTVLLDTGRRVSAYQERWQQAPRDFYTGRVAVPRRGYPDPAFARIVEQLHEALGQPIFRDGALLAFRVPEAAPRGGRLPAHCDLSQPTPPE